MLAFSLLLTTKYKWLFVPTDFIASLLLTLHAIQLDAPIFVIVNGWIAIIMGYKTIKKQWT